MRGPRPFNKHGKQYTCGHGDQGVWDTIAAIIKQQPDISNRRLAERVMMDRAAVWKIRKKIESGQTSPNKTGRGSSSYQQLQKMMYEGLREVIKNLKAGAPLNDISKAFPVKPQAKCYSSSHICTLLKKLKLKPHTPLYFHPNKWRPANAKYYQDYLHWVMYQPLDTRSRFKFFDEVRVDHRDLFKTKTRSEVREYVERSRMPTKDVYTVNCLSVLDSMQPIVYNIIPGSSNASEYMKFWLNHAYGGVYML